MATQMQSLAEPMKITDSFLLAMHKQHVAVFTGAQETVQQFLPDWEKTAERLEEFQISVRNRASELQHEKVKVPAKDALDTEKEQKLTEYWSYKDGSENGGNLEKIELTGKFLQTTMSLLTPQPRIYADEQRLQTEYPALLAQMKQDDELCREMVGKLGETFSRVTSVKEKFVIQLSKAAFSLQRFCQIVDNNGKPISTWARFMDNVTTPVVPKPKVVQTDQTGKD